MRQVSPVPRPAKRRARSRSALTSANSDRGSKGRKASSRPNLLTVQEPGRFDHPLFDRPDSNAPRRG